MGIFLKGIFAEMSLLEKIRETDFALFNKVNGEWHSSFFDALFIIIRESYLWIPFYFFLIVFVAINFKRNGWYWILFFILTAMMSDIISSSVIKEIVPRLRPCRDPFIADSVRFLVKYCPSSSSFTSSHAVNHFAAAMFIFTTFKNRLGNWWAVTFIWAALIAYAQVYVGVHFPLDVFCGAIAGLIIGYLPAAIFNKKVGLQN
jgi:undecaprenyl-diphosphatase